MQHRLLAQLLAQAARALLQPGDLRHRGFDPLRRGTGLLEVESALERSFFIPADRRELRAKVANMGNSFGGHRSLPAGTADARSVGASGWTTM